MAPPNEPLLLTDYLQQFHTLCELIKDFLASQKPAEAVVTLNQLVALIKKAQTEYT